MTDPSNNGDSGDQVRDLAPTARAAELGDTHGPNWFDDSAERVPAEAIAAACDARVWAAYLNHRRTVRDQQTAALTTAEPVTVAPEPDDPHVSIEKPVRPETRAPATVLLAMAAPSSPTAGVPELWLEPAYDAAEQAIAPAAGDTASDMASRDTWPAEVTGPAVRETNAHFEAVQDLAAAFAIAPAEAPTLDQRDEKPVTPDSTVAVPVSVPMPASASTVAAHPLSHGPTVVPDPALSSLSGPRFRQPAAASQPAAVRSVPERLREPLMAADARLQAEIRGGLRGARQGEGHGGVNPIPQVDLARPGSERAGWDGQHDGDTPLPQFMTAKPAQPHAMPAKSATAANIAPPARAFDNTKRTQPRRAHTAAISATACGLFVTGSLYGFVHAYWLADPKNEPAWTFDLGVDVSHAAATGHDNSVRRSSSVASYSRDEPGSELRSNGPAADLAALAASAETDASVSGQAVTAPASPQLIGALKQVERRAASRSKPGVVLAQAPPGADARPPSPPPGGPAAQNLDRPRPADPPVPAAGLPLMRPVPPTSAPPPAQGRDRGQSGNVVPDGQQGQAVRPRPASPPVEPVVRTLTPTAKPSVTPAPVPPAAAIVNDPPPAPVRAAVRPRNPTAVKTARPYVAPRPRPVADSPPYAADCSRSLPCYHQSSEDVFDFGWFFTSLFDAAPAPEPAARTRKHRRALAAHSETTHDIVMRGILNAH